MPEVLAGLALDAIVRLGDCGNSLVAALAPADPFIGLCRSTLPLRLPCSHLLGLGGPVTCLGRLLRLLLGRRSWLHCTDGVLDVFHDLFELGGRIDHACDEGLAALRAKTNRFVTLYHLKAQNYAASHLLSTAAPCSTRISGSCNKRTAAWSSSHHTWVPSDSAAPRLRSR